MADSIEILKKDSKFQNKRSKTIEKYNKETYSTKSKKNQNASIQSRVLEQAVSILQNFIEDMDKELEQKGNKIEFLQKNRITRS